MNDILLCGHCYDVIEPTDNRQFCTACQSNVCEECRPSGVPYLGERPERGTCPTGRFS